MPNPIRRRCGQGSGVPVILPDALSSLHLWYKLDLGSYTDTGLTALCVNDGDAMAGVRDFSGNARHATQATAAKKPLYKLAIQGGLSVARTGNPSLSSMAIAGGTWIGPNWTAFAVLNPPASATGAEYLIAGNSAAFAPLINTTQVGWFDGANKAVASGVSGFQVLEWQLTSGGGGVVRRNGVVVGSASYTDSGFLNPTFLSYTDTTSGGLVADVGEVVIYQRSLSTTESAGVRAGLRRRWHL